MKIMLKRVISLLLLLSMLLSMVPMQVLAEGSGSTDPDDGGTVIEKCDECSQPSVDGVITHLATCSRKPCDECGAVKGTDGTMHHKPHCPVLGEYCTCPENTTGEHAATCPFHEVTCNCGADIANGASHRPGCAVLLNLSDSSKRCVCLLNTDSKHQPNCPQYVAQCDCGAADGEAHKPGCDILKHADPACTCTLHTDTAHKHGDCPLHEPACDCGAADGEAHKPGCDILKHENPACTCTLHTDTAHKHGDCPLHEPVCDCGAADGEAHKPGCDILKHENPACTCALGAESHGEDCPRYKEPGCTCAALGKDTPHTNDCDLRYVLCNCETPQENVNDHIDGCPLFIPQCDCGTATDEHAETCATRQPICNCGASSRTQYHAENCPRYVACNCSQDSNDTKYHISTCPLYVACAEDCGAGIDSRDHKAECPLYVVCDCGATGGIPHDPTCPRYLKPCSCRADKTDHVHAYGCTRYTKQVVPQQSKTLQTLINEASTVDGVATWHGEYNDIYEDINIPMTKKGLVVDLNGATLHPAAVAGRASTGGLVVNNVNVYGDATFKNGTIDGTGHGNARGVQVYSSAHFGAGENLTIKNFHLESSGAGIRVDKNASLDIASTANICNNSARDLGGGVYIYEGERLTVAPAAEGENVGIHDNLATYGGGIAMYSLNNYIQGSQEGEEHLRKTPNINLWNNRAITGGGGLYITDIAYTDFTDMVLKNNTSNGDGGGAMFAGIVNLRFTDSVMEQNKAYSYGGALYVKGWTGATKNSDNQVEIVNPNVTKNTAGYGGAMYFDKRVAVNIYAKEDAAETAKRISGNTADRDAGGALRFGTYSTLSLTNLDIQENNSLLSSGGFVYAANAMTLTLRDVDVKDNEARNVGGAFCLDSGGAAHNVTIWNGNYEHNVVTSAPNTDYGNGGAFYISGGTLVMHDGRFYNNYARNSGGAIYKSYSSNTFYSGIFEANKAESTYGGAVFLNGSPTTNIKREAILDADGVETGEETPRLEVIDNTAGSFGEGFYHDGGTLNVLDAHFVNSKGSHYGGAIGGTGTINIRGGLFEKSKGSPVVWDWGGTLNIYGGEFTDNDTDAVGCHNGTLNIIADENSDHNGAWIHDNRGSGIRMTDTGKVVIHGGTIENNRDHGVTVPYYNAVSMDGGIIRNNGSNGIFAANSWHSGNGSSSVTVSGGEISGNARGVAGAVVNISGGKIINNGTTAANNNGGGVYGERITISGGTITGNTAAYGGGVYGAAGTVYRGNNSANVGGRYFTCDSRSSITITGGTIQDNAATFLGNDIFVTEPESRILSESISPSYNAAAETRGVSFQLTASKNMTDPEIRTKYEDSPGKTTAWYDEVQARYDGADTNSYLKDSIDARRHQDTALKLWEGYTFVYNVEERYVAQIGYTQYTTLQKAFDAIKAGTTDDGLTDIVMIDNTVENVVVPDGITATLDLQGKQVHCPTGNIPDLNNAIAQGTVLTVKGNITLTVKDTSPSGKGEISGGTTSGVVVGTGANVTFVGGNVCNNSNLTAVDDTGYGGGIRVEAGGTVRISGTANIHDNFMPMNARGGGGIAVLDGGTLIMDGGTIEKNRINTATDVPNANSGNGLGGGVLVRPGGTFNMTGGSVSGNINAYSNGSGVAVQGTFNMTGGKLTGNQAGQSNTGSWSGGAVCVTGTGVFTMSAASPEVIPEISGNTGNLGAGVLVYNGGSFVMDDGLIQGNICPTANSVAYGGGVALWGDTGAATFTMNGGVIAENTAKNAGGVEVRYGKAEFTMNGGTIRGNKALTGYGGGVDNLNDKDFKAIRLNGGEIYGNTAATYGGGVYLGRLGTFRMEGDGAKIYANTCNENVGNDLFFYGNGTNSTTVASIINIGSQDVTVPDTEKKYDCWHSDLTGQDFKAGSNLDAIATANNMVAVTDGYKAQNGSVGLTAAIAIPVVTPTGDAVAYYIPADAESETDYLTYPTLQAAVNSVSEGAATTEKPIPSGGTIYLMKDFGEKVTVRGVTFTLDLNGHTLKGGANNTAILTLSTNADVTVTDTASRTVTVTVPAVTDEDGTVITPAGTKDVVRPNYAHKDGGTGTLTINPDYPYGAGIDLTAGSRLTVEKCVLEEFNVATRSGAAIRNRGGTVVLNEGTVIRNCTYSGTATYTGGAVYADNNGSVTVNGGTYTNNTRTTGSGGVFCLKGAESASDAPTLTINGGTFTGNKAVNGGVISAATNCTVNIYGGSFTGNSASSRGGVLYSIGTSAKGANTPGTNTVRIDGGSYNAEAAGENQTRILFANNAAPSGGVIFTDYTAMTVTGADIPTQENADPNNTLVFRNNDATSGGVFYIGLNSSQKAWTDTISGGLYMDNTASSQGGVIYLGSHTLNITGGEFFRNTASASNQSDGCGGGVIYRIGWDNNHVELTLSGGKYHSNSAKHGGVVRNDGGSFTITGSAELYDNTAQLDGGAVLGTTILSGGAIIRNNWAKRVGGAIRGSTTMSGHAEVKNNLANSEGGAIYGYLTMNAGDETGIPKVHHNESKGIGGAVRGGLTLNAGEIYGNKGTNGGAVFLPDSSAIVNGGKIYDNTATVNGGAIWGDVWDYVYINGGEICGNKAGSSGGAIFNQYGNTHLLGGEIHDNTAGADGGAVYCYNDSDSTDARHFVNVPISGTKIYNNVAGRNGGGIYFYSRFSNGYLRLYDDGLITGNRAGQFGGGIYMAEAGQTRYGSPARTEFTIGLYTGEDMAEHGTGAIYGNSSALGQDIYTVAGSKDDIVAAKKMDLPSGIIANCWLDEGVSRNLYSEIHGVTTRFYALTLDYTVEKVVALLPLKQADPITNKTVKEFMSVQDAITFAQQNPDLIESAFKDNPEVDDDKPTLILVDDVKESFIVPNNVPLTLNLNHHTVSGQGTTLTVNGTVDIRDEYMDAAAYSGRYTFKNPETGKQVYGSGKVTATGTIEGNGQTNGGAILVGNGGTLTAYAGKIANSRAVSNGAGVYIANGTFTLDGATIENNTSNSGLSGPAVYINTNGSNFIFKSGLITGNTDGNTDGKGVIHNAGGSMAMTGGVISGNTGNSVIYSTGRLSITGGEITNNTVRYGAVNIAGGTAEIDGGEGQSVLISGNKGSVAGGGMYVSGSNTTTVFIGNVQITENSAPKGGGIYQIGGVITALEGLEITSNSASERGGGIYQASGGTLTMIGGLITENEAPKGGGIAQQAEGSTAKATVADGVKIYENKSLISATGNDIYSAYEGTANWDTLKTNKSKITLEAVKDMGEIDRYNVWRDDTYAGTAFGPGEKLNDGMYVTGTIDQSDNLQLTTYYFDKAASEEPLSDNYRVNNVYFQRDNFASGTYPTGNNGEKTVKSTPAQLNWPESTNPDDWYEDVDTGIMIKKRVNPNNSSDVRAPGAEVTLDRTEVEKTARDMGWEEAEETYDINFGTTKKTFHYLKDPESGKLYEQTEMVKWAAGDDYSQKNNLVMTNDQVTYNFGLTLEKKDKEEQNVNKTRLWIEVELDATLSQAQLNLPIMNDKGKAIPFKGYVTTREENGRMVQVMRGYVDLDAPDAAEITGSIAMNVKDMHNGDKLKPKIRSWIEGDLENVVDEETNLPVKDAEGNIVQQLHVVSGNAERLTISATGKYNLTLLQNPGMVYTGYFDTVNGIKVSKSDYEATDENGNKRNPNVKYGTMLGYGITAMLYNDPYGDPDKGIRGIELPADGLEFDVSMRAALYLDGEMLMKKDGTQLTIEPVFWAGKENEKGNLGRRMNSTSYSMNMNWNDEDDRDQSSPYAFSAAPFNSGNNYFSVFNGGGWQFSQGVKKTGEETVHIKVNGYTFSINNYDDCGPTAMSDGTNSEILNNNFTKAFTAGYMEVLFVYPEEEVEGLEGYLEIQNQAVAHDLQITSASGNTPEEDPGIGNLHAYYSEEEAQQRATNEMHYVDNYCSGVNGMFLTLPREDGGEGLGGDSFSVVNYYNTAIKSGNSWSFSGIEGTQAGLGAAPLGTAVTIGATGTFSSMKISTVDEYVDKAQTIPNPYYIPDKVKNVQLYENDEFNYLTALNMLQKIDADVFTVVGGAKIVNQYVSIGSTVNGAIRVVGNESLPSWGVTSATNTDKHPNPTTTMNLTVLYAAKPDGTNWDKVEVRANEMLHDPNYTGRYRRVYSTKDPTVLVGIEYDGITYNVADGGVPATGGDVVTSDGGIADMNKYHEEQLVYFETLQEMKDFFSAKGITDDPKCVAVLYQARDCCIRDGRQIGFEAIAQITDDFAKTGKTYATTSDSRIWSTYRPEYRSYRASTSALRTSSLLYDFNWDTIPYIEGSVAKGLGLQNADGTPDSRTFLNGLSYDDVSDKMPDREDDPDRTDEKFFYYYKKLTHPDRYQLTITKDGAGNEVSRKWNLIPLENTERTISNSTWHFCSVPSGESSLNSNPRPYIKTEYAYGYFKPGTHNFWYRGNTLLVHTLQTSIAIVVKDKINEYSNASKSLYNLSNGEHLVTYLVDPKVFKQSRIDNRITKVTDGSQSTKVDIYLDFPLNMDYAPQTIAFDYTPDRKNGVDLPTYKEGELTWEIGEPVDILNENGEKIGTRVILTTRVPDVQKNLPKISFTGEIAANEILNTTVLNVKTSIRATYEEYNALAATVQEDATPITAVRNQYTGIFHNLLQMPQDRQPGDTVYSSLVEVGEDFGYELTYYNDQPYDQAQPAKNVRLVDVLPYNIDERNGTAQKPVSTFTGGYTVKRIRVVIEGPHAAQTAASFETSGKLIYGGKHQTAESIAKDDDTKGLTKDEKLTKAYTDLLGTPGKTDDGLFNDIVAAGISKLLNGKMVKTDASTAEAPKFIYDYDLTNLDLCSLIKDVRQDYLSKLPEGAEKPTGEALDNAIKAKIKQMLGLTDADLSTKGLTTLATDTVGHMFFVDIGDVYGESTVRVNVVLNGAQDVPKVNEQGNPVLDTEGNPVMEHKLIECNGATQVGGNSYKNGFAANSNEAQLKSQKDRVTVVNRKLSGFVFLDMNHDGRFSSGIESDKKLENIEVWLYKVEDGVRTLATDVMGNPYHPIDPQTNKPTPVLTETAPKNNEKKALEQGSYCFNNLGPGEYMVVFKDPSGKVIDSKMKWEDMSVTILPGDDGDPNTDDPFWINANMNRSVAKYAAVAAEDPNNGISTASALDELGISPQADNGDTVYKLDSAELYSTVHMPAKNEMKTATVVSSDNNAAIYCIEAKVEKRWTGMIEQVKKDLELLATITGQQNGYAGTIKLTQGKDYKTVTATPDENITIKGNSMTVDVLPTSIANNTRVPTYTWTTTSFYLTAETYDGAAIVPVTYNHTEQVNLKGYDDVVYSTELITTTGITKFVMTNNQRAHDVNLQKVDYENPKKILGGAKFAIEEADGTRLQFVEASKGVYYHAADNVNYSKTRVTEMTVDDDGMLKIQSLPERDLYLVETKAPKGGYIKASGRYKLDIGKDGIKYEDLMRDGKTEDKLTLKPQQIVDKATDSAGNEYFIYFDYFQMPNIMTFRLPTTGSEGIAMILTGGLTVTALGALLLLEYRRRKRKNQTIA